MITDVHTHLWSEPEQLGKGTTARMQSRPDRDWDTQDASPNAFDDAMKTVGCALILGFESQYMNAEIPIEQVAGYMRRQPEKYVGIAGIDPLKPGYLERVDQAVEAGLAGVCVSPAAQNCHPTHSSAMRLYAKCEKLGLPILVHPGTHLAATAVLEYSRPHLFDEVGRSFPNLRVVLAQMGHPWVDETLVLIGKHAHFYADLSDVSARPWELYTSMLMAYQLGVTEHLLLGSDFPFCTPEQVIVNLFSVNQQIHGTNMSTIPRNTIQSIVERDALTCLGIADKVQVPIPSDETDEETEADAA